MHRRAGDYRVAEWPVLPGAQQAGIADLLMKPYNKIDLSVSISHVLHTEEGTFQEETIH